jgi:hypothetical protein
MYSKNGYKRNSKDKNNPYNIIPSSRISMKDVDFPVLGVDDLGYSELMTPGGEYEFPGNKVLEVPLAQLGGDLPKAQFGNIGNWVSDQVDSALSYINPYNYERTGDKNPVASFFSGEFQSYPRVDAANFESAFAKAQEQHSDKPYFIWNDTRYKNDLRGETRDTQTQDILEIIKNAEDISPELKESFSNLWSDLNQPNLRISDVDNEFSFGPWSWSEMGLDEGRDHVNPLSSPGGGSLYIKEKGYDTPHGYKDTQSLIDAIVNELTHVYQQNQMGRLPYVKTYIEELIGEGFDQNALYSTPGSLEEQAHGDILRMLETKLYGEPRSTGNYAEEREGHTHEHQYGGPINYQFGGITDWVDDVIINPLKVKIRDEIAPVGYANAIDRIKNVLNPFNQNKQTDYEKYKSRYDKYSPIHGSDNYDPGLFQGGIDVLNERQDLFSILLGLDQKHNTIPVSKYKPTRTKNNDDINYYSSPLTEKQITDFLAGTDITKRFGNVDKFKKYLNDPGNSPINYGEVTGNFLIDHGEDERGPYVSYYDIWDLDPFGVGDWTDQNKILKAITDYGQEKILGVQPAELYNRLYYTLDDEGKIRFDDYPDAMSAYDRHQLEKKKQKEKKQKGGESSYQFPTPKMVNEYYNPSEPFLTDEERSAITNWVNNLQDSTKSLGTYYMMDEGDGTVFYESKDPKVEDISFSSPEEYNAHRKNLGLPEDWTLIEKRQSDKLKDPAITNKLNAIDTDVDADEDSIIDNKKLPITKPDTTARMDNLANIPMSDKLKQIESSMKLNKVSIGEPYDRAIDVSTPKFDMLYHHKLKDVDKGKITRELNKNVEKNNIKVLEAERDKQRSEMYEKFYDKWDKDNWNLSDQEEVIRIQQMLVENGYDVGKYKYGEKAGEDLIDGRWGPLTEKAYGDFLNNKFNKLIDDKRSSVISGDYDFSELLNKNRCDEKGCAAGMFNMYADIVGWDAVRNSGMVGNAWQIKKSMQDSGANIKYNIYANKSKPDYENLHSFTTTAVKNNPLDYSILQEGDVVGIYSPTSGYNRRALNEGNGTYNSHVGMISGYDTDGMPIVTHNLNGWVEHDRADKVQGLTSAHPMTIAWVADPIGGEGFKYDSVVEGKSNWNDYSNENKSYINFLEAKFFDHEANTISGNKLQYWDTAEKRIINDNINHVKNNVSKIVDELGIPMDENALTQTVLGILGTETQFGLKKLGEDSLKDRYLYKWLINTYQGLPFEPFGPREKDLDGDGYISDDEKLQAYDMNSQEVSKGIAKMKLSKIDPFTKNYFDLNETTIEDDKKSINVLIAKTAKAKHLLSEYSKKNPDLGLGDMDLWNMAALTHNQGDDILMHFGSNPKYTIDEQVKRLKNLYEGRVSAMDATNWKHVANLSQDESWKDLVELAYEREQMAKYIKNHPEIFNQLPDGLKGQVKYLTERNNLRDIIKKYKVSGRLDKRIKNNKLKKGISSLLWAENLIRNKGVKAFDMEDLRPYFDNYDHFEYAKGSESYISKVNRYANLYEREIPFEHIWYTREGQKTRSEILNEMLIRNGNFEALVDGLDPLYEDMLIGQYYHEDLNKYPDEYQKGGSVPTEEEAKKNPRYNRDMDEDGIPVGVDIDDSARVPKEVMLLQSMKESSLDPTKVSSKGAKGLTQIRPDTLTDYIKATGDKDVDVFDWKDSMKIQDWYMNNIYNRPWINKQNQSQDVRLAKTLAAYNWGPKKFNEFLNRKKSEGIDIYDADMAWVKDLPVETRDYINTILLRQNEEFEGWVNDWNKNEDKKLFIDAYKEEYKKGGSLIFPTWKRIKKHWKKYLSGKAINPDMYEKLVAYGYIKKKKYRKKKRKARNLKSVPSNIILNSINLGKMKKGGDLEKQVRIYEDYVNGIFDNTSQQEKAVKAYDKMNRLYLYDSRDSGLTILDHMKKKLKDK